MKTEWIKKLQSIPQERIENNDQWIELMTMHKIPLHILFKINFIALKGEIKEHDIWIKQYVANYPNIPNFDNMNNNYPAPSAPNVPVLDKGENEMMEGDDEQINLMNHINASAPTGKKCTDCHKITNDEEGKMYGDDWFCNDCYALY